MSKIVLIGANHAGTAAANTILDNYPGSELTIIDRNDNISYLGCGTALWIGKQIEDWQSLFYSSAEMLEQKGASVMMETSVDRVDFETKIICAADKSGKTIEVPYDKLILATGSLPIIPPIPGIDLANIQSVKLFQDGEKANALLDKPEIETVAVVGAGYIGVEVAEAIVRRGKKALLFEAENTSLSGYYDEWLTHEMDKNLAGNGVELHYGERVTRFEGDGAVSRIITDKGEYDVQMAILSIGFRPNTALGKDVIETFPNGAYTVNLKQETSLPDVWAIGDCATVYSNAVQAPAYIALATNAVRSGIVAGHNVCGTPLDSIGVQGSNGISIFGYNMVSTGLSVKAAAKNGIEVEYTDYEDWQKPVFIKASNDKVKLRIVYEKSSRRIVGAQAASRENISLLIHMFSLAIEEKVSIDRLKLLDIFFLPHFNQPYNYITMAALSAK